MSKQKKIGYTKKPQEFFFCQRFKDALILTLKQDGLVLNICLATFGFQAIICYYKNNSFPLFVNAQALPTFFKDSEAVDDPWILSSPLYWFRAFHSKATGNWLAEFPSTITSPWVFPCLSDCPLLWLNKWLIICKSALQANAPCFTLIAR